MRVILARTMKLTGGAVNNLRKSTFLVSPCYRTRSQAYACHHIPYTCSTSNGVVNGLNLVINPDKCSGLLTGSCIV
jgi:hypothetical protein